MTPWRNTSLSRSGRAATRGLTLVEILVVLTILALLAGVLYNSIAGSNNTAKVSVAELFVRSTVRLPLQTYSMHVGSFPTTEEGLRALVSAVGPRADRWKGPYLDDGKIPTDPWGEPYQYRYPGTRNRHSYDLWSKGPDLQDGTADDIGNWSADAAK